MAVYQGARRRGFELPRPSLEFDRPRRAQPSPAMLEPPARVRRPTRVGAILAIIIIAFSLAFLSLSQSVRVAATSYDLVRLGTAKARAAAEATMEQVRGAMKLA